MITDMLGAPVEPGDFIAYPGRSGSSLWMNVGVVTKIDGKNVSARAYSTWSKRAGDKDGHGIHMGRAVKLSRSSVPAEIGAALMEVYDGQKKS